MVWKSRPWAQLAPQEVKIGPSTQSLEVSTDCLTHIPGYEAQKACLSDTGISVVKTALKELLSQCAAESSWAADFRSLAPDTRCPTNVERWIMYYAEEALDRSDLGIHELCREPTDQSPSKPVIVDCKSLWPLTTGQSTESEGKQNL